ncbi:MAG: hypothetical protein Q8M08_03185 [Bacteroidales bacterium]|nr:hypothetical protein [Bacteroidales bacterium]
MKTMTFILAAVFALQVNVLFADSDNVPASGNSETTHIELTSLAPVTPVEVIFEEVITSVPEYSSLAPVVPAEADFNDVAPVTGIDMMSLAPVTPASADFNDQVDLTVSISAFAPSTPAVADFE